MKYFDSHAHYYDERFGDELDGSVDSLIDALLSESVSYIVNVGTMPSTSRLAAEQARRHKNMYTAIGIHPGDTRFLDDLDAALAETEALIRDPENKCVCLGEIGLDYHWHEERHDFQKEFLHYQLDLSEKLDLPVIIHDREAHGDCLEAVFDHPNVRGVFHSYSGSAESAKELVKRGWYISFSGVVTFKNASRLSEIVPTIPEDRLLVETDCPYLTPHPHRGERNDSSYLTYTIEKLASLRGASPDEIASLTLKNAATLFNKCGIITEG